MFTQLPTVTQREFLFSGDETLLSSTDTASHISYANAAFIRVSGYSAAEMAGQAHKLVRHPDMPVQAFADMWHSLRQGQSWTALVKNRRKDGDHYWVRANAAPMRRNGQVVGYLSVRTKPAREEVAASEALYARFRQGRASGLAFHRGLIVRTGLLRWLSAGQLLPVAWRVRLPLLLAGAAIGGGLATLGLAPAVLALRYDCDLYTAICYRVSLAKWRLELGAQIATHANGKMRPSADIIREMNLALEAAVRRDPANWFWVHRRWKD